MDEDKERQARKIRLRIMMLQKELASTQYHASLGSFLQAGRPSNLRNQAERDRERLEGEIAKLREQLEALTPPKEPPVEKAEKKAVSKKKTAKEKKPEKKKVAPKKKAAAKKKAAPKKAVKKKAAPKKAASKKTVKKKASPKKAKKSR